MSQEDHSIYKQNHTIFESSALTLTRARNPWFRTIEKACGNLELNCLGKGGRPQIKNLRESVKSDLGIDVHLRTLQRSVQEVNGDTILEYARQLMTLRSVLKKCSEMDPEGYYHLEVDIANYDPFIGKTKLMFRSLHVIPSSSMTFWRNSQKKLLDNRK